MSAAQEAVASRRRSCHKARSLIRNREDRPMGERIQLRAADGFTLGAYKAAPNGKPKGGIVVIQEIFGVNNHIRKVADGFAADGYLAIAPALYDRISPGVETGYTPEDIQKGIGFRQKAATETALQDIDAARKAASEAGKVATVGYCWGGFLSWCAATRLNGLSGCVVYYGGGIGGVADETPKCPILAHFGERDQHIPLTDVDKLRSHKNVEVHVYAADHGFNCDERGSYDKPSAETARQRTLAFFARALA
jgi:carboxymethylenebutenolidase